MNKLRLLLLSTFIFSLYGFSQDIPALWTDFREGSSSARVKACDELARYYRSESQDTLKILGEELFMYGIDHHYYPAIEEGKLTLADYFILSGKTADGIAMTKALLPNMEERGDDRMLCAACRIISKGYTVQKDAKSAYHWADKAMNYGKNNPDPIIRVEALSALAESYYLKNQPKKAIEAYRNYITELKPFKKYRSISSAYARLGDICRREEDMKLANQYFRSSLVYAEKSGRTTPIAHALNNMAILYFEEGDTIRAREHFERALQLRLKAQDAKSISESYYNMGDYHFYISKYDDAIAWYKRSLDFALRNNLKVEQADALKALAAVARETQDFKGATAFLEQHIAVQEELLIQNSSDDEEVASLQQTITRLEAEHKIQNAGIGTEEDGWLSDLRWEWLVIGVLVIVLGMVMRNRKMTPPES